MKFEKIKFTNIHPSKYNPRKINKKELKTLSRNLNEFGLVDPIIINLNNNNIIGGHQRYTALQQKYDQNDETEEIELNLIRLGDIGWVFETDNLKIKDENNEKALNLSLNKISGEWDYEKLSVLLNNLEISGFDTKLTGFTSFEIDQFTIPSDLNLKFKEIDDIDEGKMKVNEEGEVVEEQPKTETQKTPSEDEIAIKEEEIEKIHKYKCPNCGYEW